MSRAEEFVSMLTNNPELQAQLNAASTSADATKIVANAGFGDVSRADVQAVLDRRTDTDELSESQLSAASGAGFMTSSGWQPPELDWNTDWGGNI